MNKSWIANGFTAANALFGGLSIMMSISGEYHVAAICILIAMAADAFDGRVARALGTAGPMGVELDSLSDDISPASKLLAFLLCPCSGGIAFYGGHIPYEAEGQLWRQVGMVWRVLFNLFFFICV